MKLPILYTLGLTLLFACDGGDDLGDDVLIPPKETDCSKEVFVDATSMDVWIYYDLETQKIVTPSSPEDSDEWDLAFQRFKVKSNGGISGTGGVEVAQVVSGVCNDLLEAPATGYLTDAVDGPDEMMIEDYAISFGPSSETGPWGYDPIAHQLFASGAIFIVKSVQGNYFKLDFFEYYGPTGNAAELTFRYQSVKAPEVVLPPGVIEVESSLMGYTYLDIEDGVVTVADPATSTDWDLAVSGPAWRTNGGKERAGFGGARIAAETDYDAISTAPTVGYRNDATIPYPGPPGSGNFVGNPTLVNWFNYDPVTHLATPKDEVYLIRGGDGSYGKLRILEYDNTSLTYRVKLSPVTRDVAIEHATIDASDETGFKYFSLRLGTEVMVTDPSTNTDWDLGLSRTRLKTNSGTSGAGQGGAAGPISMPLEAVAVPASFSVDAMIADPENAGSMYSGSPILAEWFEVVGTSTTPKDAAFVVRTADGGFSKVKVIGWSDGEFSIDHAYAGAGGESF